MEGNIISYIDEFYNIKVKECIQSNRDTNTTHLDEEESEPKTQNVIGSVKNLLTKQTSSSMHDLCSDNDDKNDLMNQSNLDHKLLYEFLFEGDDSVDDQEESDSDIQLSQEEEDESPVVQRDLVDSLDFFVLRTNGDGNLVVGTKSEIILHPTTQPEGGSRNLCQPADTNEDIEKNEEIRMKTMHPPSWAGKYIFYLKENFNSVDYVSKTDQVMDGP